MLKPPRSAFESGFCFTSHTKGQGAAYLINPHLPFFSNSKQTWVYAVVSDGRINRISYLPKKKSISRLTLIQLFVTKIVSVVLDRMFDWFDVGRPLFVIYYNCPNNKGVNMTEFKKILFPVDLSETSPKLVPHVKKMAEKFDSEIHIVFVARLFGYFTGIYVPHPSISQFEKEVVEGAEKKLYEFKDEYFADNSNVQATVLLGDAAEKILDYSKDKGIDLLIMGTHGRKGLDKIVFGSVAERVIKAAEVPILIINPHKALK